MSTGLTQARLLQLAGRIAADLKSQDPQVVVIMIGANDAQDFLGPPDVPYTSPQWNTMYAQRVAQFMRSPRAAAPPWSGSACRPCRAPA